MSLNLYYSVKDPEQNVSFKQTQWLSPYQVLDKLGVNNLFSYQINPNRLIYPNELIISESTQCISDIIFLSKYTDRFGVLKLESIFLSQLISVLCASNVNTSMLIDRVQILSIEKDTYYWECVRNSNQIPRYAFRVGFDNLSKQFSYIGRMKVSLLNENISQSMKNITYKITNMFGSLVNIYEYIPAMVLQLHGLDNRLDSLWSRIKLSIKNNYTSKDLNLIANNYEVLCLKKQPASLKQLCKNRLVKFEEETNELYFKSELNEREKKYLSINSALRSVPKSMRCMLWPSFLVPGQCLARNSKMRSLNDKYELILNEYGHLGFSLSIYGSFKRITYEKNVESMLISHSGVYIIYENNRRPTLLYKHQTIEHGSSNDLDECSYSNIFDNLLCSSYVIELSNDGFLRIIIHKNRPNVVCLFNVNEIFSPVKCENEQIITNISVSNVSKDDSRASTAQPLLINLKFVTNIKDLKNIPFRIIGLVVGFLRSFFQSIGQISAGRH